MSDEAKAPGPLSPMAEVIIKANRRSYAEGYRAGLEAAAREAEADVDWTALSRGALKDESCHAPTVEKVRDYRIGILAGRSIAAAIRSLASREASHE